jgi:O-antigen ligase
VVNELYCLFCQRSPAFGVKTLLNGQKYSSSNYRYYYYRFALQEGINFKFKDWEKISFVFLLLMFGGICRSLWQYAQNINDINAAYLKAYTIETPLGNDHVRFSLLVVIAIFTIIFLLAESGKNFKKITRNLLFTLAIINIIYLHVLAVRTGLICFYLGVFIFLIWLLLST